MILSFFLSSSFLLLKRYIFFEDRLDWKPTSKMEKIQHALCLLRHLKQSWLRLRKRPSIWKESFSNLSLSQIIAKSVKRVSVTTRSMLNMRFIKRKWIKMNLPDISKDLSKIFTHSNKRLWREASLFVRKGRILRSFYNWELKRSLLANQNSEPFQLQKSTLNWRRTISFEKSSFNGWKRSSVDWFGFFLQSKSY